MTNLKELKDALNASSLPDDAPVFVKISGREGIIEIDMIIDHSADVKPRNKIVLITEKIEV